MLFDQGKGISFGDKNHPSKRRINFIFSIWPDWQGAFGLFCFFDLKTGIRVVRRTVL
jgi:hypothetical protein